MRLVLLVVVMCSSAAFALPGEQVSKLTLGAEEATKSLSAPPPAVAPLPPSAFGAAMGEPLSAQLRLRLIAMELRSLRFQKNDLVGPMILTLLGGTGVLVAFTIFGISAATGSYLATFGLVVLMVAGGPLLIGLPWLIVALVRNGAIEREIDKLELERSSLGVSLRDVQDVNAPASTAMVARF